MPTRPSISISKPAPGTLVDRAALRRGLRTLPAELGVPLRPRAPAVGVEQARIAQRVVTRLLDGPREVRFRDATAVLPVATLAALVTTKPWPARSGSGSTSTALRRGAPADASGASSGSPPTRGSSSTATASGRSPDAPGRRLDAGSPSPSSRTSGARPSGPVPLGRAETRRPRSERRSGSGSRSSSRSEFTTNYRICCAARDEHRATGIDPLLGSDHLTCTGRTSEACKRTRRQASFSTAADPGPGSEVAEATLPTKPTERDASAGEDSSPPPSRCCRTPRPTARRCGRRHQRQKSLVAHQKPLSPGSSSRQPTIIPVGYLAWGARRRSRLGGAPS